MQTKIMGGCLLVQRPESVFDLVKIFNLVRDELFPKRKQQIPLLAQGDRIRSTAENAEEEITYVIREILENALLAQMIDMLQVSVSTENSFVILSIVNKGSINWKKLRERAINGFDDLFTPDLTLDQVKKIKKEELLFLPKEELSEDGVNKRGGLGLFHIKKIIEKLGSKIIFQEDEGTVTFSLFFPLYIPVAPE
ncbi:MAG: hypothetical protein ABIH39_01635 [Candidatus Margulisiibacteriota bacterium]